MRAHICLKLLLEYNVEHVPTKKRLVSKSAKKERQLREKNKKAVLSMQK